VGAILEATPEMGEWSVEVRRESAYLHGTSPLGYERDGEPEPRHVPRVLRHHTVPIDGTGVAPNDGVERGIAFAIPVEDVREVVAALDQIMDHDVYRQFVIDSRDGVKSGVWSTPVVDGDLVQLHGPAVLYGGSRDEPWRLGAVKLAYSDIADLRQQLSTLA
jgi:hypothetical protein